MKTFKSVSQKQAIIIGASMGGLLAARVLSDHFENVTLIEKDPVSQAPESRKGQPHTQHLHGLLAHGFDIMSSYFPELKSELKASGAMVRDLGQSMRWYVNGGYKKQVTFQKEAVTMSRPFLEYLVRKSVLQRPNIELMDRCSAKNLIFSPDQQRVIGLQVSWKMQTDQPQQIMADLVVDASGRGANMLKWLEKAGYPKPKETIVKVKVGYASCVFRRNPTMPGSNEWVFVTPGSAAETRLGGAFAIEGDRWQVTLGGLSGDYPGTDAAAFINFAKSLPAPDIYEIVSNNEALTEIKPFRYTQSARRHYEKTKNFPEGLLVFGDAICSFNPIYGQGMTVAAMEARAMDLLFQQNHGHLPGLAKKFFKKAAKIIDIPWQSSVGEDFRYPQTEGKKPLGTDLLNAYVSRIHRASHYDEVVGEAFMKVMNLLEPPTSLFHPRILWRTLFKRKPANHPPALVKLVKETEFSLEKQL